MWNVTGFVVGGDQHRDADLVERSEHLHDFGGRRSAVQAGGRFVGEQDVGRFTTARAMHRRCCSPPESVIGLARSRGQQADLVQRGARAPRCVRAGRPVKASGSMTLSNTLRS